MSRIGGTRSGNAPTVDNNANQGAGVRQDGVGHGLFKPGPNVTEMPPARLADPSTGWNRTTVSEAARAKGPAGEKAGITIGASADRVAHGKAIKEAEDAALPTSAPTNNQQSPVSSDEDTSGVEAVLKDAEESNQKGLEAEGKRDERDVELQKQDLKKLHEHLQELQQSPPGTTASTL